MEDDDDDFYGGNGVKQELQADSEEEEDNDHKMEVSDDEEDDSDDDVQFTLDKPEGAKADAAPTKQQQKPQHDRTVSESRPPKSSTPTIVKTEPARASSTVPPTSVRGPLTHNGKEGKDFPEIHTSKLDVNGTPTWINGKAITEIDIDADLAESSKPWRLPGTDITDFFNYGFDEYTWTQYCVRQQMMDNTIDEQRQQDAQMKAFFGGDGPGGPGGAGGGGGGPMNMPGMPPGMSMPNPQQMEQMVQNGVFPPEFAQMMMSGNMQGMGGMPNMGGMGGGQGGGGFGSGQNSISPNPQPGQGFQPPQGPSGGQFPGGNIEGYSPQQLAIMQQEQHMQGPGGGGGRGGRGRRGRW